METTLPLSASRDRVVDVIDRTFRVYRTNFLSYVLLFAIVLIPFYFMQEAIANQDLLSGATTWEEYYDRVDTQTRSLRALSGLYNIALLVVVYGLTTYMASEAYLGRKITPWRALRERGGRLWRLGLTWLLMGFVFGLSAILVVVIGVLCWIPFILLPVILYLWVSTYFFITQVMMLENIGVNYGVRRAIDLGKTHFWPVFGLVLGLGLISVVIEIAFGATSLIVLSTETTASYPLISLGLSILLGPLMPIGLTMMYYHYRTRYEGLDLALQASDVPDARPWHLLSPDVEHPLVTGQDILNMVILVAAFVVLFIALVAVGVSLTSYYTT
ncbi:hypothetical protein [Aggregatilinea lenta]|uniref:hypothetical protein n=1 Tax=Aggregatilinea lenta TaxID=913108 RepID=UPI0013C2DB56|nr:hypothetical protein [Aggregatilinea lenta]